MQGTAIPNLDMGAASIKMNDDGSFNLLVPSARPTWAPARTLC